MLNITNHQGNENQTHNEVSPYTCQNGYYQRDNKEPSVGKDVEKREPSCTVGRNVNWYSHLEKQYGGSSKKLKIELLCNPTIPILDIFLKKTKTHICISESLCCTPETNTTL